jgi:hypothetical protein
MADEQAQEPAPPPPPPLYSARPEWADITPVEQYENITPVAPILYEEACTLSRDLNNRKTNC